MSVGSPSALGAGRQKWPAPAPAAQGPQAGGEAAPACSMKSRGGVSKLSRYPDMRRCSHQPLCWKKGFTWASGVVRMPVSAGVLAAGTQSE